MNDKITEIKLESIVPYYQFFRVGDGKLILKSGAKPSTDDFVQMVVGLILASAMLFWTAGLLLTIFTMLLLFIGFYLMRPIYPFLIEAQTGSICIQFRRLFGTHRTVVLHSDQINSVQASVYTLNLMFRRIDFAQVSVLPKSGKKIIFFQLGQNKVEIATQVSKSVAEMFAQTIGVGSSFS
jgi:hypothetical protein